MANPDAINLVLDLGNSRDKWAVFQGSSATAVGLAESTPRLDASALRHILTEHRPHAAIVSTTGPDREDLLAVLRAERGMPLLLLDHKTPLPFQMAYKTPATLGRDRLAAVAGARIHVPMGPVLVVDAGTCITYDFLNAQDVYLGGAIAPGVRMRLEAMHTMTARLPLIAWQAGDPAPAMVGDSTAASLLSGACLGAVAELEGFAARYRIQYPDLSILLTGGDGSALAALSKKAIFAVPLLPLEGLSKILNHNALHGK